uniref:AlNc14C120G6659 protein n=1 Tax=Albugo laibachii Nc14 TaxID=890382 RepID=F0WJD2_9STRA|nr:AlNc14C120G6659 [Albugo laibachii Nc14]|eukprot:CCA21379.1 AlNc14C120G6659 [Albugo laibachii Nc14]
MKDRNRRPVESTDGAEGGSVLSNNSPIDEKHIHCHSEDSLDKQSSKSPASCRKCATLPTLSLSPYQLPSIESHHQRSSTLNSFFCNCARIYADLMKPARSFPHEIDAMASHLNSLVNLLCTTSFPVLEQLSIGDVSAKCSCCLRELTEFRERGYPCSFLKLMSSFLPTLGAYGKWMKKNEQFLNQPIVWKATQGLKTGSFVSEASHREAASHGHSDVENTERFEKLVNNMEGMLALHRAMDQVVYAGNHLLALIESQEKIDHQSMPTSDCTQDPLLKLEVSFLYRMPQLESLSNDYKEILYDLKKRLSKVTEIILEHADNIAMEMYPATAPTAKEAKQTRSNTLMKYLEKLHTTFLNNFGIQILQNPCPSTTYLLPKIVNQCLQPTFIDFSVLSMQLNDVMAFQIDQALKVIRVWYRELETSYNAVNATRPNPCAELEACLRPYIRGSHKTLTILTLGILYPKLASQDVYAFARYKSILGVWLEASENTPRQFDKLARRQINIQKIRQAFKKPLAKRIEQDQESERLSDKGQQQVKEGGE